MINLQITLFTADGKYRPISTIIPVESVTYYKEHKQEIQVRAVQKICSQRKTDPYHLKLNGYTKIKARVYDKEKIDRENAERYERIKKERGWS